MTRHLPAGRALGTLVLAVAAILLAACTTDSVPYVTVAQFARGDRPAVDPRATHPGVPPGGTLLRATIGEVRTTPSLLVELNDPRQEEHIWVTGFSHAPGRGQEVWTAIAGPPVAHEQLGATYPSVGVLAEPLGRERVTERGALGAVVGGTAVFLLAAFALATRIARQAGGRQCPGCAGRVAAPWLTCPRCGHTLAAASSAAGRVRVESTSDDA